MKKLLFAAALLVATLTGCQNRNTGAGNNNDNAPGTESVREIQGGLSVAYINIDSLIRGYDRAIDMQNVFQEKYMKAEREIQTKAQRLEKDVLEYQDKAQKGLMTRSMAAETEERLNRQNQQLIQDRDRLMGELQEEEQVMNNTIFFAISDFLKEHNADFKYSMIISTTAAGPLLHADPALSITEPVLKALNEAYAAEKSAKKK